MLEGVADNATIDPAKLSKDFGDVPPLNLPNLDCSFLEGEGVAHDSQRDTLPPNEPKELPGAAPEAERSRGDTPGQSSDASSTERDERNPLYREIMQKMRDLQGSTSFCTQPLTSRQRRDVRIMAYAMQLGHKTVRSPAVGARFRVRIYKLVSSGEMDETRVAGRQLATPGALNNMGPALDAARTRKPSGRDLYQCRNDACGRKFGRNCDLRKHEKLHKPKDSRPHRCTRDGCTRTFIYPKDLRRHENVHQKNAIVRTRPLAAQSSSDQTAVPPSELRGDAMTFIPDYPALTYGTSLFDTHTRGSWQDQPQSTQDMLQASGTDPFSLDWQIDPGMLLPLACESAYRPQGEDESEFVGYDSMPPQAAQASPSYPSSSRHQSYAVQPDFGPIVPPDEQLASRDVSYSRQMIPDIWPRDSGREETTTSYIQPMREDLSVVPGISEMYEESLSSSSAPSWSSAGCVGASGQERASDTAPRFPSFAGLRGLARGRQVDALERRVSTRSGNKNVPDPSTSTKAPTSCDENYEQREPSRKRDASRPGKHVDSDTTANDLAQSLAGVSLSDSKEVMAL